jgi:hypothetical protein
MDRIAATEFSRAKAVVGAPDRLMILRRCKTQNVSFYHI